MDVGCAEVPGCLPVDMWRAHRGGPCFLGFLHGPLGIRRCFLLFCSFACLRRRHRSHLWQLSASRSLAMHGPKAIDARANQSLRAFSSPGFFPVSAISGRFAQPKHGLGCWIGDSPRTRGSSRHVTVAVVAEEEPWQRLGTCAIRSRSPAGFRKPPAVLSFRSMFFFFVAFAFLVFLIRARCGCCCY
ncbi:hypothetical protein MAPG_07502 [Magnaporthiopsis poae ATCC 64411]|uniref:Uncharacterized protein n=1 Tax=Magnaporthiopsis poae (strain ATCC 64411 / 73-15) TaxID=644358 RepID=A0A0C4E4V0_MAGP6|nr:hypothetical protein MAPG_07502 [Magnaporthiopsis poae ATCC 64411]